MLTIELTLVGLPKTTDFRDDFSLFLEQERIFLTDFPL